MKKRKSKEIDKIVNRIVTKHEEDERKRKGDELTISCQLGWLIKYKVLGFLMSIVFVGFIAFFINVFENYPILMIIGVTMVFVIAFYISWRMMCNDSFEKS